MDNAARACGCGYAKNCPQEQPAGRAQSPPRCVVPAADPKPRPEQERRKTEVEADLRV